MMFYYQNVRVQKCNKYPQLSVINTDYLLDIKQETQKLTKKGTGRVVFISISAIQNRFNRSFQSLINLSQTLWKQIESVNKIQNYVSDLTLDYFQVIHTQGIGDYGCTLKVISQNNIDFALRVIQKGKAMKEQIQAQIIGLHNKSSKLTHILIAKQYRMFSDPHRLYFLSRWVEGQDLYDLVQRQKKISNNMVKHFSACIINIMEYLHSLRTVWRELKIQSFIIDHQGYLTLIDLMHLQSLGDEPSLENPNKATFLYLAPQILSSQGHGFQTDFWSLGVIIYRMLVGEFPYGEKISIEDNKLLDQLWEEIHNKPLALPSWLTSDAKALLKILLDPNPFDRNLISFSKLKAMAFFKDYDWLGLMEKKVTNIPYLPKTTTPKYPQPIALPSWIEHQTTQLPPPNVLDELQPHSHAELK